MAGYQTVKLYGVDVDSNGIVEESVLIALTHTIDTSDVATILAEPKFINTTYLNDSTNTEIQWTFQIEMIIKILPAASVNAIDYYFLKTFANKFQYLHIGNYPIRPFNITSTQCIRLKKIDDVKIESVKNYKKITFKVESDV